MKYTIRYVDGHDLKYKNRTFEADTPDEAISKLYNEGDFDHKIGSVEETDMRICPECQEEVDRADMHYTRDYYGIPFRLLCYKCYQKAMAKGYDGQYYSTADECIDYEY